MDAFSGAYTMAKVVKHSPRNTYTVPSLSQFGEIKFTHKSRGLGNDWQSYWTNPNISLHVLYLHFGDDAVLGEAIGLFPSIGFSLLENKSSKFYFTFGAGIAYLTKKYNKISNPINNAIGSHLNNVSRLSIDYQYCFNQKIYLQPSIQLTHFSNAKTNNPNSGINLVGLSMGLGVLLDEKISSNMVIDTMIKSKKGKWGGDVLLGYGVSEYAHPGGPKQPNYFINLGAYRYLSDYIKFHVGLDYDYSESVFQFYYHDFDSKSDARKKATNTAFYFAPELLFGRVGLRFQTGIYLPYPNLQQDDLTAFYFKLGANTYFGPEEWRARPYIGILLKSHIAVAQYLGFVSGVSF